jgi:hypothetical protein
MGMAKRTTVDFWADAETKFVQPYQAVKTYLCPGCNREIERGVGHIVAVPPEAVDLRRHWHRGCWNGRAKRMPRG